MTDSKIIPIGVLLHKNEHIDPSIPLDFPTAYDVANGESSPTEDFCNYMRDLAERFYQIGYKKGQYDERLQTEKPL